MATDYTPTTVTQGFGAETQINKNFTEIKTAIDKLLNREIDTDNAMEQDLDFGGKRAINLPKAVLNTEPVRLGELNNLAIQEVVATITYAAAISIDPDTVSLGRLTLTGNTTITFTGAPTDGQPILLAVKQDATGSRIITWESRVRFSTDQGSTAISTAASKLDYILLRYNSGDDKYDVLAMNRGF